MADINALIAQGIRPIEIQDPVSRAARFAALEGAQQERQMNALRMQEYQRGVEEQNALRELLRSGVDLSTPEGQRRLLATSPTAGQALIKGRLESGKLEAETQMKQVDIAEKTINRYRDMLPGLTSPEQARQWTRAVYSDPTLAPVFSRLGATPEQAAAAVPDDPAAFENWRRTTAMRAPDFINLIKEDAPKVVPSGGAVFVGGGFKMPPSMPAKPTNLQIDYAAAVNQGFQGSLVDFARAISEARRAPTTGGEGGALKAPPGYRFTPEGNLEAIPGGPAAPKPLSAQQTEKLKADMSKNRSAAIDSIDKSDDILNVIQRISTAPGLSGATGLSARVFSMPEGAAARAETLMGELKGKVTGLGKAIASASGAIGSIATQEWKILADMVANLDPTKGQKAYLEQLKQVELYAERVKARVSEAYNTQYEDKFEQFPNFQLPKTPPTEAVNALLAGQGTDAQFDAVFGPGAAARARKKGK